jgi:hypothetical protein
VGTTKVVAAASLLLAAGSLLMLGPWWPPPALFVALSLLLAGVAVLLTTVVAYKDRLKWLAGSTTTARLRRPRVSWQAGRWDTDPRHGYVANVGDGTAYEVNVTASDRVIATAQCVPPYRADRLSSPSEPPCYLNFCVDQRLKRPVSFGSDRAIRSALDKTVDPDRLEVIVQVSWRSENSEYFTQTVRTGT